MSCIGRSGDHEIYPFGDSPQGQLVYTDSHMIVFMESSGRKRLSTMDSRTCSAEEIVSSYNECECYCGTYELMDDALVVHHVESSKNPNLSGMDLARKVTLSEGRLQLDTVHPLPVGGVDFHFELLWEKVETF